MADNVRFKPFRRPSSWPRSSGLRRVKLCCLWRAIPLDDSAVHLDTSDGKSICTPDDPGDPSAAQLGVVALRRAHHGGGERTGVNDGGGSCRAELGSR
jgi:hypothetical protein